MLVGCPLNGGAEASTSEKDCKQAGVNTNICYNLEPLSQGCFFNTFEKTQGEKT